jgi:tetratricopeptide (TPR) repeat protein
VTEYVFDKYVFDEASGCFSHDGRQQVLRNKTAMLLAYLLKNEGQRISKDELLSAVWGDRVVSENTLNQGISELRRVLDDNASAPRFIRTIPGEGFCWICPLGQPLGSNKKVGLSKRYTLRLLMLACGFVVVLAATWFLYITLQDEDDTRSVIFLPLENSTGDTRLDWLEFGYSDLMRRDLVRHNDITVLPEQAFLPQVVERFRGPYVKEYGRLFEVLETVGADTVVSGRIANDGDGYLLTLMVVNRGGGNANGAASFKDSTDAVETIAAEVANLIFGRALNSNAGSAVSPVAEANRLFALGQRAATNRGADEALGYFDAAANTDPAFMLAHLRRAEMRIALGELSTARISLDALLSAAREASDTYLVGEVLLAAGRVRLVQGELDAARTMLTEAKHHFASSGDDIKEAEALRALAAEALLAGRWLEQQELYTLAADRLSRIAGSQNAAAGQVILGLLNSVRNDIQASAADLELALRSYKRLGQLPAQARLHLMLANLPGAVEKRREHIGAARSLLATTNNAIGMADADWISARVELQAGNYAIAARQLDTARAAYTRMGMAPRATLSQFLQAIALILESLEAPDTSAAYSFLTTADDLIGDALSWARDAGAQQREADLMLLRAQLLNERGDAAGSVALAREAVELYSTIGLDRGAFIAQATLVAALIGAGDTQVAVTVLDTLSGQDVGLGRWLVLARAAAYVRLDRSAEARALLAAERTTNPEGWSDEHKRFAACVESPDLCETDPTQLVPPNILYVLALQLL